MIDLTSLATLANVSQTAQETIGRVEGVIYYMISARRGDSTIYLSLAAVVIESMFASQSRTEVV